VLDTGRDDVLAYERASGDRRLLVLANLSTAEIRGFRLPGQAGGYPAELTGAGAASRSGEVTLPALAARVYVQDGP
jgi:hypothetical protein